MDMDRQTSRYLPPGYRLDYGADTLALRRADGSFAAVFSARAVTKEAVLQAAREDYCGYPAYFGPEQYAASVRRLVAARMKSSWERFLRTERRMLGARKNGQLAKALVQALPGESPEELDKIGSEDRSRAQEGLVELRNEEREPYFKHIDELRPEDRPNRIRAELARIEWLLERQKRRNALLFRHVSEPDDQQRAFRK
jgi:hypothetical protein